MVTVAVLTAATAPGLALLAYVYLKDRYVTEPIRLVVRLFLIGMQLVFPTMVVQRAFVHGFEPSPFVYAFGISALAEEFFKWFALYFMIYKHAEFDEPYDGIVYAAAVSLGFATLENVLYAIVYHSSFSELMLRALLPVSGHALFGIAMGYYMGRAKFGAPHRERLLLALALFVPLLWHGLFDFVLLRAEHLWLWLMLPLMAFYWGRGVWKINRANARSPFRRLSADDDLRM